MYFITYMILAFILFKQKHILTTLRLLVTGSKSELMEALILIQIKVLPSLYFQDKIQQVRVSKYPEAQHYPKPPGCLISRRWLQGAKIFLKSLFFNIYESIYESVSWLLWLWVDVTIVMFQKYREVEERFKFEWKKAWHFEKCADSICGEELGDVSSASNPCWKQENQV